MIAAHDRPDAEAVADAGSTANGAPEVPIIYVGSSRPDDVAPPKDKRKGKGSRWNSVRHGLMAELLLPADLAAEADQWTAMFTAVHCPTSDHECKLIAKLGRLAAQLDRYEKLKIVDLQRTMDRAVLCWNADRCVYINQLAAQLGDVMGVGPALAETRQGAEWLIKTWVGLEDALEITGGWDEAQCHLALAMLDVRPELWNSHRTITAEASVDDLAAIIADEIGRLEDRLERCLIALDLADRDMAAAGMPLEEDAATKRLRKQEGKVKLEYCRTKAELLDNRAQAAAAAAGEAPTPPAPPPPPRVVSSPRVVAEKDTAPTPRPKTSNAAFKYLLRRSQLEAFDLPATATSPARRVDVRLPFPGGDPLPSADLESDPEADFDAEVEPAAVRPQPARVASNASRAAAAAANDRREKDRKQRRDQQKKARKAARRNRR